LNELADGQISVFGSRRLAELRQLTSPKLISDFVVFDGTAYGFDGGISAGINLETGNRTWKGGRDGKGKV